MSYTPDFTIGADIELALIDEKNKFVSAVPYCEGTKQVPIQLPNGTLLSHDNVALEFAIPPCSTKQDFVNVILESLDIITEYLKPFKLRAVPVAAAKYRKKELQSKAAKEFGCSPDFNAFKNGATNAAPDPTKTCWRSFGGHVHIGLPGGYYLKHKELQIYFVRLLEVYLNYPALIITHGVNEEKERKKLYGQAGCYRTPLHGIEYRTLSNFWIKDKELIELIYTLCQYAVSAFYHGVRVEDIERKRRYCVLYALECMHYCGCLPTRALDLVYNYVTDETITKVI